MKKLLNILVALSVLAIYSYGTQQSVPDTNKNDFAFDFSKFYNIDNNDVFGDAVYYYHRDVPVGKYVVIDDLDSIFGKTFLCDTVYQSLNSRRLYEQEVGASRFFPTMKGDTLVMLRRVYGHPGDWMIWIALEITNTDSLRVLNFIAYDNSTVQI